MKKTRLYFISVFILSFSALTFGTNPKVMMETNFGDITIELYPEDAPVTVDNFLRYVNDDFYDGTVFHRAINNFMIQAGGYYVEDYTVYSKPPTYEPIINESNNGLLNVRGTISMALTTEPDSATSHFFINQVNNSHLDYPNVDGHGHCVFGAVVEGMDVVDSITLVDLCNLGGALTHFPCNPPVEIISVYEIPEPTTLSLLAFGGLLLRKANRIKEEEG